MLQNGSLYGRRRIDGDLQARPEPYKKLFQGTHFLGGLLGSHNLISRSLEDAGMDRGLRGASTLQHAWETIQIR